jgi:ring-1,2-phenylacetyl-CoA epoxidase subunit PaaC
MINQTDILKMNSSNNNDFSKAPPLEGFREAYTLHLADNALILAQRNSEWCGHGPVLEQDIAITNISLDLIGQARNFYQYAAKLINESPAPLSPPAGGWRGVGGEVTEDSLAYLRDNREFKNCLLVEQPNGDWAQTILRQFFFSNYQFLLYQQLQHSKDEQLAAIAAKALKEVTYHLRWSSEWVIRLGDGTEESRTRMLNALDELWTYTGELFVSADYELKTASEGAGVDAGSLKNKWEEKTNGIFLEATLHLPENVFMQGGGKQGKHSEYLGHILADLQFMQRAYTNSSW